MPMTSFTVISSTSQLHLHDITGRLTTSARRRPENILYRTKDADSDIVIVDFGM